MNNSYQAFRQLFAWRYCQLFFALLLLQFSVAATSPSWSMVPEDASYVRTCRAAGLVIVDAGIPQLRMKAHRSDGEKDVFIYSISHLDAAIEDFFTRLKAIHSPSGASVGPSFLTFAINKEEKTVTIGVKQGAISQEKLLTYLQQRLNHEFGPAK